MRTKELHVPSEKEEEKVGERKGRKKEEDKKEGSLLNWIYLDAIIIF